LERAEISRTRIAAQPQQRDESARAGFGLAEQE